MKRTILLTLLLAACASPAWADTTGALGGRVDDYTRKSAIGGATVRLWSPAAEVQTATDARGHFALLGLIPGRYIMTVTKDAYQPVAYTEVDIFPGCQRAVRVDLAFFQRTISHVSGRFLPLGVQPGDCGYNVTPRSDPRFDDVTSIAPLLQMVPGLQVAGEAPSP